MAALVRCHPHHPREYHGDTLPAEEPGVHHAAGQGRGVRPLPRALQRTPQCGHAHAGHTHPRVHRRRQADAVSGHFRRCAVQARRAVTHQHRADPRESCGGYAAFDELATRHTAARPDVRQRHVFDRGGTDVAEYSARHRAQLCV